MNLTTIAFLQSHWELVLAFCVVLGYWIITEIIIFTRGGNISVARMVHLINREEGVVIDLRPSLTYAQGHILHALSIPQSQLLEQLSRLKKYQEKPIILVDENGLQAGKSMGQLRKLGFTKSVYLKNGMQAWLQAQLPVHKN